ncbi:MAG: ABC transporter permease/substrate-binding protein [Polyangiaceae bacterium]
MKLADVLGSGRAELLALTAEHLLLVVLAAGAAVAIGVPVGILLTRRPSLSRPVLAVANVLQTVPSLALFGFLIPVLGSYGIGRLPAIIALFLYSLLPIIRNTYAGIQGVDAGVREAGRGLGMTDWQLLTMVDLPLAATVITAGVRVATVISIGTATVAAAIGAGGLGTYIFRGLRMNDTGLILAGAVPAAVMALVADALLGLAEKRLGRTRRHDARPSVALRAALPATATAVLAGLLLLAWAGQRGSGGGRVVVGSKDFTEQVLMGELLAQAIERHTGLEVERRFELGGDLAHRALVASGEVDVYVEYTGTALLSILKHPAETDAARVLEIVRAEYPGRFGAEWLAPLGFDNTFAVLVRGEDARRLGLKTISDVVPHATSFRAAFGQDFMSREDGYPGFARAYALRFTDPPREMDLSLTYRALASKQVDLIAGNSTDGLIEKLDLVQLEDDRHYFPPYQAAPVLRQAAGRSHPEVAEALQALAGRIDERAMRRANLAVDGERRDPKRVAAEILDRIAPR